MKPILLLPVGLLLASGMSAASRALHLEETNAAITVNCDGAPVLTYHKAVVPPPEGASPRFARSGFIHPLHAPHGGVVTSIHAADHIHHLGLWHAWVHTTFRGRKVDFWNLLQGLGTVRFAGVVALQKEADASAVEFAVRQEHVALAHDQGPEEVVLEERLTVRVQVTDAAYVLDYVMEQRNVTDAPLELPAYRYGGGIAFRAPEAWGATNDAFLTSEGRDRTQGHATRGRWCVMHGPTPAGEAAVVILDHPANHDAPQRVRIWPEGKVFFNYVPAQESPWRIAPGEAITLRYRVLVFAGRPGVATIDAHWQDYAAGN